MAPILDELKPPAGNNGRCARVRSSLGRWLNWIHWLAKLEGRSG